MNQDLIANQESLAGGNGGFSTSTGYATGTTCTRSGTYRASNKYMDIVQIYAKGDVFLPFADGKKTTWYALSSTLSSNSSGSFESVKVEAGAV